MDMDMLQSMAEVAHVYLEEHEKQQISKELGILLEQFDKLGEVDTEGIAATAHPITDKNVLREDKVWESLPIEEILRNAPDKDRRFFRVPRIIE